jgi:hypothetical protein
MARGRKPVAPARDEPSEPPQQHQPRRPAQLHGQDGVLPEAPREHRNAARIGGEQQVLLLPV